FERWAPLAKSYDPLKCGTIDGTITQVHDHAIVRAMNANYKPNKGVRGSARRTLFVGRLNYDTTSQVLKQVFSEYGEVENVALIRDVVTGYSRGYAFIEYRSSHSVKFAYHEANNIKIDGKNILVDYEHERRMKGWVPRRLGGGFGGKKEAGQLRFGCRDRPYKRPIRPIIKEKITKPD
uniref:U11/U12 small nuclear ribonucleoprotein 35 kDa protein n=1 Tax=Ciona savignyi TaxID=51511 RepID=H2Y7P7_CIOSA